MRKLLAAVVTAGLAAAAVPANAEAYVLLRPTGKDRRLVLQLDGAARPQRRIASGVFGVGISPGGSHLAFGRGDGVRVRALDRPALRPIDAPTLFGPQLSRDGTRLLLEAGTATTIVGRGRRIVLPSLSLARLSPDGRRVAYAGYNDTDLRIRDLDGGRTVVVRPTRDESFFGAAWTAAGLVVGVGSDAQRLDLVAEDGSRRRLAQAGEDTFGIASVSRDGRLVLLERVSESRDVIGLEVLDVTTGTVRRLPPGRGVIEAVGFCEDGSCAYLIDGYDLERISLSTRARRVVRHGVEEAVAG